MDIPLINELVVWFTKFVAKHMMLKAATGLIGSLLKVQRLIVGWKMSYHPKRTATPIGVDDIVYPI